MRRSVQDPCAQSRPRRPEGRRLFEDQPDCAHPDPDRSRGSGRKAPDRDAVLGDPDVSLRKDWQVPAGGPGSPGTDVPVDGRRRRRLRPDQSEHLLSRRADAGKGAGFGDQVLRGPLRQSVALCRRAACLILDVSLPDLNGLDLQKQLAGERLDMPIIFITGYGDIPMTVRAMKAGAVEFLTKPFAEDALLGAIRHAIDHSTAKLRDEAELQALRDCYASLSRRE